MTPSLNLAYAQSIQDIKTRYVADQILFPGLVFPVDTKEKLTADRFGGGLGMHLTFRPTRWLALIAGGTVGFQHVRASYVGEDCFGTIPVPAPCNNFIATSVQNRQRLTGLTAGFDAGASVLLLDRFVFAVLVSARYDRSGLAVRYPNEVDRRPASLELTGRWQYGVRATVTLPLRLGGP